ncbi:MAG: MBL fold metallo-hydrolase, partial [Thermoanaerobaculia bacterium]|nr:MBL fold metallo-hydrolase [Thermoanaerobaculia bacterium]
LEAEGALDRGARLQGSRPGSSDPGSYQEWLVIDERSDRVGFQQRHRRYDEAIEHWRFVYSGEDLMRISDPIERFAAEVRDPSFGEKRRSIARLVPHLLVGEAFNAPASLRWLGLDELDGERVDHVSWSVGGDAVTLMISHDTGALRAVEAMGDEPLLGDVPVRWIYDDYEPVEGLGPFPTGYSIELLGRTVKRVRFSKVEAGAASSHAVFSIPDGIRPPRTPPASKGKPEPRPARVIRRAPWVWQVAGIRAGFNVAFFEMEEYVVAFEAPSGWLELHQIPPGNFATGETSSSISESFIDLIHETVPGKPIRYVVLSHFHGDHAGGVRAFIEEGATIVTSETAVELIRSAAERRFRIGFDRQEVAGAEPEFLVVDDSTDLSDGERSLEILEISPNPHVEGMLAIWLPEEKSLFVADLFHAQPLERYPSAAELPLQKAFVEWLDETGIEPERIYGVHGGVGTPAHLEKLRGR